MTAALAVGVLAASQMAAAAVPLSEAALKRWLGDYQHLHRHPELSLKEEKTAAWMAERFSRLGYGVTTRVGGHGVVALLRNGRGPTLMLRADMDALPVEEKTGLPYASRVRATRSTGKTVPVMHACGHDMHMTVLAATAEILAERRETWRGTLMLVAQPAEELGRGAQAMLKDGLFTRFPRPDFALALHVSAELPAGTVGYSPGYAMATADSVHIRVRGVGGHGAYPHRTRDPVVVASQIVLALQTIVSREVSPLEPAVITVGSIHGGTKGNVIPDEVELDLTVRSFSLKTRERILEAIRRTVRGVALAAGVEEDRLPLVKVKPDATPSLKNDPQLGERVTRAFEAELGKEGVRQTDPVMGAEDFARYGRTEPPVPVFLFWLGAVPQAAYETHVRSGGPLPSLHSATFAPDPQPTLRTGVRAMAAAALELLAVPAAGE